MKASFPSRINCAPAASVVICPLANSIALSPRVQHCRSRRPAVPKPALPAVTSRSAWLALEPVESRSSPYYRATPPSPRLTPRASVADVESAAVGQRPRHRQARSAAAALSSRRRSVIGERAGRRHRGPVFEIERRPAPIEASPVRALFDPSAVLSSMKASFPLRCNARSRPGW